MQPSDLFRAKSNIGNCMYMYPGHVLVYMYMYKPVYLLYSVNMMMETWLVNTVGFCAYYLGPKNIYMKVYVP